MPQLTELHFFKFAGIETRTKNQLEINPETASIGALWQRFYQQQFATQIANRIQPQYVYGVYYDYQSDHNDYYRLIAGVAVSSFNGLSAESRVEIVRGTYLSFEFNGPLPETVINGWQQIWQYFADNNVYQRAYTVDFERYHDSQVEIFIAIK